MLDSLLTGAATVLTSIVLVVSTVTTNIGDYVSNLTAQVPSGTPISTCTGPNGLWGSINNPANGGLAGSYYLANNIDCTGINFTPLGSQSAPFTGTFDGNNFTLTNISINNPANPYAGLFTWVGPAGVIKNVKIVGLNVSGQASIAMGGLVGYNQGTVQDSYVLGVGTFVTNGAVDGTSVVPDVGGLVGKNSGTIRRSFSNIPAKKSSGSNGYDLGGLVGDNAGIIVDSYALGNVTDTSPASGNAVPVGGLVGGNYSGGSITNSYAIGTVSGYNYVGGLVGQNYGTITNSFAAGTATATAPSASVGGLIGLQISPGSTVNSAWHAKTGTPTYCYIQSGASNGGCLIPAPTAASTFYPATFGVYNGSPAWNMSTVWRTRSCTFPELLIQTPGTCATITDVSATTAEGAYRAGDPPILIRVTYAEDVTVTGIPQFALNSGGQAVFSQAIDARTLEFTYTIGANDSALLLDIGTTNQITGGTITDTTYSIPASRTLPVAGTAAAIGTKKMISIEPTNTISITDCAGLQNMNLNYTAHYVLANDINCNVAPYNTGQGFTPIGVPGPGTVFTGSLNGMGHTISGLFINRSSTNYVGLFGFITNADIQNLTLSSVDIRGNTSVGGLVGSTQTTTIYNVHVSGTVVGSLNTGGIAGSNGAGGYIINAHTNGTFSGQNTNQRVGGIVGQSMGSATNPAKIIKSTSAGTVSGGWHVAGLVGAMTDTVLNQNVSTATINGTTNFIGGLVGECGSALTTPDAFVRNSYATGPQNGAAQYVGGLVGYVRTSCLVENSYATGNALGNNYVGGLIGFLAGAVRNSYATGNATATIASGKRVGALLGFTNTTGTSQGTIINSWYKQGGPLSCYTGSSGVSNTNCSPYTNIPDLFNSAHDVYDTVQTFWSFVGPIRDWIATGCSLPILPFETSTCLPQVSVTNVTSSLNNGTYGVGQVIPITVTFSAPVTVTGTPNLLMETGITDRQAVYVSGGGTTSLIFNYTVEATDQSIDLDYQSVNALTTNGGTIKDASLIDALLTLPSPGAANSLSSGKSIVIDTQRPTINGVTAAQSDGSYGVGQVVSIVIYFNESIAVTGAPQLLLETGTNDTTLTYAPIFGPPNSVVFNYTVAAGDASPDLDYIASSALTLNGGTIKDAAGNDAILTLADPGQPNSLGANKAIVIDTVAPTVIEVSSTLPDGTYGIGNVIPITVKFSKPVSVSFGPQPQLILETGATDAVLSAVYQGGMSDTVTFNYTVASGHISSDLNYQSTTALSLNGATIRDAAQNNADLALPLLTDPGSLGSQKDIVVDSDTPVVLHVTSSNPDASYKEGDTIAVQIVFSENVVVTGTPTLELATGVTPAIASYISGSNTNTLIFHYIVGPGESSTDLNYVSTTSLSLGFAAQIMDVALNSANLTLPDIASANSLGQRKNIVIDTTVPQILSVNAANSPGTYGIGDVLTLNVVFTESVEVTGAPLLHLETGTTDADATYVAGDGSNTLSFEYTVIAGHNSSDLNYVDVNSLLLNSGTINDIAGNATNLVLPATGAAASLGGSSDIRIDTTAPQVVNITSTTANGAYGIADTVEVTVEFTEPVFITTEPELLLETGTTDSPAVYTSGAGTTTLTFTYTVTSGDLSSDLDYESATALTGVLKDGSQSHQLNSADLTLPDPGQPGSLGANKDIEIDSTIPTIVNVTSTLNDGIYKEGDVIPIRIVFSKVMTVTGTPQLLLETGATDRTADYVSGGGSTTLIFNYTVQAGDSASDLDYASESALTLNNGTIVDNLTRPGVLTLAVPGDPSSLGANKDISIDTMVPTVATITSLELNDVYKEGDVLEIHVQLSESVTVTGTPTLTLETGSTDAVIPFTGMGPSDDVLIFTYTVSVGDTSDDLDAISLQLAGGTIRDAAGNDLNPIFASGNLSGNKDLVIDTLAPSVLYVTSPELDQTYGVGDILDIEVVVSEVVYISGGATHLTLETGTIDRNAVFTPLFVDTQGTTVLRFQYTVAAGDDSTDLNYLLPSSLVLGGPFTDLAGHSLNTTLPALASADSLAGRKNLVIETGEVIPLPNFNLSGTAFGEDGILPLANKKIGLSMNGGPRQTVMTDGSGLFTFGSLGTVNRGTVLTLFFDDEPEKGVTVLRADADTMTGIKLYQDKLALASSITITNEYLSVADLSGEEDIVSILSNTSPIAVTVASPYALLIEQGTVFQPEGTLDVHSLIINGTLDMDDNPLTVRGNFTQLVPGTFVSQETVTFTGVNGVIRAPATNFNNLTINSPGTVTLQSPLLVSGNVLIQSGTLDAAGNQISLRGDWRNQVGDAGYTANGGAVILIGDVQNILGSTTFNNFGKNGAGTVIVQANTTQTILNAASFGNTSVGTLTMKSSINGTPWYLATNRVVADTQDWIHDLTLQDMTFMNPAEETITCLTCTDATGNVNVEFIICGNGIITPGSDPQNPIETCDDGNRNEMDGCSASCKTGLGWECTGSPSLCSTFCGDGIAAVGFFPGTEVPIEMCDFGDAEGNPGRCGDGDNYLDKPGSDPWYCGNVPLDIAQKPTELLTTCDICAEFDTGPCSSVLTGNCTVFGPATRSNCLAEVPGEERYTYGDPLPLGYRGCVILGPRFIWVPNDTGGGSYYGFPGVGEPPGTGWGNSSAFYEPYVPPPGEFNPYISPQCYDYSTCGSDAFGNPACVLNSCHVDTQCQWWCAGGYGGSWVTNSSSSSSGTPVYFPPTSASSSSAGNTAPQNCVLGPPNPPDAPPYTGWYCDGFYGDPINLMCNAVPNNCDAQGVGCPIVTSTSSAASSPPVALP